MQENQEKANRLPSEKIELAAHIGSIVLASVVSVMQIFRMVRGGSPAQS